MDYEVFDIAKAVQQENRDRAAASLPESQPSPSGDAEPWELARVFHEIYERLAPQFSYRTRIESATPWEKVPTNNKQLMIATCAEVLQWLRSHDAKVGQAEQRLKKSLLDMLHNHGCESGPCNACKSARAALQESPSDK